MTGELLLKFLNDQCTEEEQDQIINWIKTDGFSEADKNQGFDEWNNLRETEEFHDQKQFDILLKKIHQKIITHDYKLSERPIVHLTNWLTKAAAILLVPVLCLLLYTLTVQHSDFAQSSDSAPDTLQVVTPMGSRTVVHLPDGSEVHMNHSSILCYPQKFTGKTRQVVLNGEGYFKIAHDPVKPFYVKAGMLNIKAVGTEFDVLAYPEEKIVAATLVCGKITVEQNIPGGEIRQIKAMVPGQHVSFSEASGDIECSQGNIEKYIAWKDGRLVFDNDSITEVTKRLSRLFNVDISVSNDIRDYTYTVTFVDEPLFQILELMKIATPVKYKILPRKKLSDGTFSRLKIILERRN